MAAIINTNLQSLNAQRNLSSSQSSLATSMQRLSSGLRINSAKDDAAGLAISERMTTQVRGLTVAARNANDGISLAQTAEGALGSVGNNLQRIRELAVQSRNATNSTEDRAALNAEVQQLKAEIGRIAEQTSFNSTKLLNGTFTNMAFQVGANQGETININGIANVNVAALGEWTSVPVPTAPVTGAAVAAAGAAEQVDGKLETNAFTAFDYSGVGNEKTFTVDGETVTLDVDYNDAAGVRTAIEGQLGAGYTVTEANDKITIEKKGSLTPPVFVDGTGTALGATGTTGEPAKPGTFAAVDFSINGTPFAVDNKATTPAAQMAALVKAINIKSDVTGVFAVNENGQLKLSAVGGTGDIKIAAADGTALLDNTGLAVGDHLATPGTTGQGFTDLNVTSAIDADNAILAMDAALTAVNDARATLGAVQSRFETTVANLSVTTENLSSARSRIMDADFAVETANLSRSQILQQAGTAMVAQANQLPQQVLQLLQG